MTPVAWLELDTFFVCYISDKGSKRSLKEVWHKNRKKKTCLKKYAQTQTLMDLQVYWFFSQEQIKEN